MANMAIFLARSENGTLTVKRSVNLLEPAPGRVVGQKEALDLISQGVRVVVEAERKPKVPAPRPKPLKLSPPTTPKETPKKKPPKHKT